MIDYSTADETCKTLRASARKAEQGDRPAAEGLDALRKDGVFALRAPQAYGGTWAGAETITRCLASLGRACPSTAWIAGTCVTVKNIAAKCFPGPRAPECFADPDALLCGSGAPSGQGERVTGGVRVSGRWSYVSGCEDAAWAVLGLMADGAFSFAVVPVADLSIERTWHMAGMRGTGSHTLHADGVVVPTARVTAAAADAFTVRDLLLYGLTVLGPVVGAARGALDTVNAMFASDRKPFMTMYSRIGESPGARHWLADATRLVNRAESTMLTVARIVDVAELPEIDEPRRNLELADAAHDCRAAVERMLDLHGASGFDTENELQRFWRDIAVGSRHRHLNPYLATEAYGTALASRP